MLPARIERDCVPAVYSRLAPVYNVFARLVETRAREVALAQLKIREGADILEVAVGTGLTFEHLVRRNPGGRTAGVDITPAMLRRAEKRISRAGLTGWELVEGDAYDLPFPDRCFDLVFNAYMFDLLPEHDFPVILSEFRRVLRDRGHLILVNMAVPRRAWHGAWELLYRMHPPIMGGCRGVQLHPHLSGAGFDEIETQYISQLTFPSEVVSATRQKRGVGHPGRSAASVHTSETGSDPDRDPGDGKHPENRY